MYIHAEFNIKRIILSAVVMGVLLSIALPMTAAAQGKPDLTGQERAASVGNKGNADAADTATSGDAGTAASDDASDEDPKGAAPENSKPRGLERAASNAPNEAVRTRLETLRTLLAQLKSLFAARFSVVGEAMRSGDDTDAGSDADDTTSSTDDTATSTDDTATSTDDTASSTDETTDDNASSTDGSVLGAHTSHRAELEARLSALRELVAELQSRVGSRRGGIGQEVRDLMRGGAGSGDDTDGSDDDSTGDDPVGDDDTSELSVRTEFTASTEVLNANDDATASDDTGEFTLTFDVTAIDADASIANSASNGATAAAGVIYAIEDSAGATVTSGVTTASLTSTADIEGDNFIVSEGETETFVLKVVFDPDSEDFYRVQLQSITVNGTVVEFTPAEDYRGELMHIPS